MTALISQLPVATSDPTSSDIAVIVRSISSAGGDAAIIADLDRLVAAAESTDPVLTKGYAFDVTSTPTVTNGAYSGGDIVGGLLTLAVARVADEPVIVTGIQIALKAAVTSTLTVVLFEADPTSTTKTDNSAYSLNAADTFKVRRAVTGFTLTDHGTPNTYFIEGLNIVMNPATGSQNIYALIIDGTGFTLTSTSDLQFRICGIGA